MKVGKFAGVGFDGGNQEGGPGREVDRWRKVGAAVLRQRQWRQSKAAAAWSSSGGVGNDDVLVVGARSGSGSNGSGGTDVCGSGGSGGGDDDDGWTPSPTFLEQPLEREEIPFFSEMTARVFGAGGGCPFPFDRVQNGPRGERAHLRPMTQRPKHTHRK